MATTTFMIEMAAHTSADILIHSFDQRYTPHIISIISHTHTHTFIVSYLYLYSTHTHLSSVCTFSLFYSIIVQYQYIILSCISMYLVLARWDFLA